MSSKYICPLCKQLLLDPVMAVNGVIYNRKCFIKMVDINKSLNNYRLNTNTNTKSNANELNNILDDYTQTFKEESNDDEYIGYDTKNVNTNNTEVSSSYGVNQTTNEFDHINEINKIIQKSDTYTRVSIIRDLIIDLIKNSSLFDDYIKNMSPQNILLYNLENVLISCSKLPEKFNLYKQAIIPKQNLSMPSIIKKIIKQVVDVIKKNKTKSEAQNELLNIILSSEQINYDYIEKDGRTLLSYVYSRHIRFEAVANEILERSTIAHNYVDEKGYTSLMYACNNINIDIDIDINIDIDTAQYYQINEK